MIKRNPQFKKPGPQGRWKARAAADLKVSLAHLCQVVAGQRISHALTARLEAWKKKNRIAA